ncbi:dephospho-CoA kinase [Plebeiibacterium marinum]|uniref:Dephospho-CoA kinase n=1 Tax=Plebeiibacterium marinum TaxID=2992111 RepID=A0AAE3MEY8_9BACT|nr:dephospho-CoA kinase [Plebeiobacterium marinum]MCW3806593.1 dephospho-CoA kinase [Plebeiobacterium marinum]
MISIGITGGIGSGKSTVCKIFETLGVPVYYADARSRMLTDSHPQIISGVKSLFGGQIYTQGKLDRKRVGEVVFKNKNLLNELNRIIHPVVAEDYIHWSRQHFDKPYVLKEAAILFESGAYKQVDKIVTVSAPRELKIMRVMQRDGVTREDVMSRMNNQWDDEQKVAKSDYVIYCNDTDLVVTQVLGLHEKLINSKG